MAIINYDEATRELKELFEEAERAFLARNPPPVPIGIEEATSILFSSETQSFREALLGCALARLQDGDIDIRLPYTGQGDAAFNGRTLDQSVVNPFLHDRRVPSSKGPYLAVFRRNVKFTSETRGGLRDKSGYDAMLSYLDALEVASSRADIANLIVYLLYHFVALRDAADIPLAQIGRLSLEQHRKVLTALLQIQSGGLIPVLLTVALLETLREHLSLEWDIQSQGINVADKASGAGGDVTVLQNDKVFLAIEITERPIDRARVVSTFNTKIVTAGIPDYLFVHTTQPPSLDAREAAATYFAQGHEINFLHVEEWISGVLATIGATGRSAFTLKLLEIFEDAPAKVKVAWNDVINAAVAA